MCRSGGRFRRHAGRAESSRRGRAHRRAVGAARRRRSAERESSASTPGRRPCAAKRCSKRPAAWPPTPRSRPTPTTSACPAIAIAPKLVNYERLLPDMVRAVPFGDGFIDYEAFFAGLVEGGFDGVANYEMCSPIRGGGGGGESRRYARGYLEWMRRHAPQASGPKSADKTPLRPTTPNDCWRRRRRQYHKPAVDAMCGSCLFRRAHPFERPRLPPDATRHAICLCASLARDQRLLAGLLSGRRGRLRRGTSSRS